MWGQQKWGAQPSAAAARPSVAPLKILASGSPFYKQEAADKLKIKADAKVAWQEQQAAKAEELQQKRIAAEQKRNQAVAALHVRKVIQKVRVADEKNFETLCVELEEAQIEKLEAMGPQAEQIREEAEKALEQARERIEKAANAEQEKERKKLEAEAARQARVLEAEAKRKADQERIAELQKQLEEPVEHADMLLGKATEAAKPFSAGLEATPEELVAAADATEEAVKEAQEAVTTASKELPEKRKEMGKSLKEKDYAGLNERLKKATVELARLRADVGKVRKRAARWVAVAKIEKELKVEFQKHDKDKDGKLNRKEVSAYAKTVHDVDVSAAFLDRALKRFAGAGVPIEKFSWVKAMVMIEKSTIKARKKKAEDEEKQKVHVAAKADVSKVVEEAKASIDEVKEALESAKKAGAELAKKPVEELVGDGDDALNAAIAAPLKEVAAVKESLDAAETSLNDALAAAGDADDKRLEVFKKSKSAPERKRIESFRAQLKKAVDSIRAFEAKGLRYCYAAREPARLEVALCVTELLNKKEQTAEQLFEQLAGSSSGSLKVEALGKFLRSLSGELPAEVMPESLQPDALDDARVQSLFRNFADGAESMSSDEFTRRLAKVFYRVTKQTVITEDEVVNSKGTRRLEEGELLQALGMPKVDENTKVKRMQCRLAFDAKASEDSEKTVITKGYATVAGNKGTVFLTPWPRHVCCIKEAVLSEELGADSTQKRKLAQGEVLEVLEWDTKDVACNMTRLRCKAVSDDATGWVSLASSKGVFFLEPC